MASNDRRNLLQWCRDHRHIGVVSLEKLQCSCSIDGLSRARREFVVLSTDKKGANVGLSEPMISYNEVRLIRSTNRKDPHSEQTPASGSEHQAIWAGRDYDAVTITESDATATPSMLNTVICEVIARPRHLARPCGRVALPVVALRTWPH